MKITDISTTIVNAGMRNWVFVRVDTSEPGLYGLGEATLEWKTRSVAAAIEDLKPLLIGKDPRDIERNFQILTKHSFWRLGAIGMSAISGIDIALWDIMGKDLNVPVWRLLGGRTRDEVKVYTHLGMGDMKSVYRSLSSEAVVEQAKKVVENGYKAFKIVCVPYTHYSAATKDIDMLGRIMRDVRSAVGEDIEIMVDFHGRPASGAAALAYIDAIAAQRPLFVEEPVPPGDTVAMKMVSSRSPVAIASGERLVDIREFENLLSERAVAIAQPDLCHAGGFTAGRKIAAMAEAVGIGLAPHNPLGPLASVAALHFAVATQNFVIQEEMSGSVPWFGDILDSPIERKNGNWQVPERPGLGVTLNEALAVKHPFQQEPLDVIAGDAVLSDGTVVDW
ncbi:galactonate dehydratase [Asticcacaulis sp.]|uniref:galactonate dehydratase n=1 Tax=Asticcacaulis sp. TaxID=1872648 RepID=UPI002BAE1CC6|nr:galactonate dehydratase [Asticcacaulis sp.]HTM81551.1 galactonate dehydratase [Asticcacaulis sp.]